MPRALTISWEGQPQFAIVADDLNEARTAVDAVVAQLPALLGDDWHFDDVREHLTKAGFLTLDVSDYEPDTFGLSC